MARPAPPPRRDRSRVRVARRQATVAARKKATPAQIALAWILARRPWLVPIPGTTKLHRLDENIAAAELELTPEDLQEIEDGAERITPEGARYSEANQRMIDR